MTQLVQARCPKCKKVLRIPLEWVARPMRCKHCQQIFQGKAPPSAPTETAPPTVAAAPAFQAKAPLAAAVTMPSAATLPPAATMPSNNETFDDLHADAPLVTTPRRTIRKPASGAKKAILIGMFFFLAVAGVAASVAVFAGPALRSFFRGDDNLSTQRGEDNTSTRNAVEKDPRRANPDDPAPNKKGNDPFTKGPKKGPTGAGKKDGTEVAVLTPAPRGAFPRRALLININDYLLMNPLAYGSPFEGKLAGSSTGALAFQFTRPPLNILEQQIAELSDGIPDEIATRTGRKARAPLKDVIENTLTDFLTASRDQDRIIVVIAGHVVDGEKECYLMPIEGNKDKPETLISLKWIYDKLAKCKARQKVLILDVCRFAPAKGLERPAPGEMSEQLDAILAAPPDGVQVWSSCMKGQQSIELERGSLFLSSVCGALMKGVKGIQEQTNAIPVEPLVAEVNQRLRETLGPQKIEQVSRLAGKELDNGALYDPDQPMPERLAIRPPSVEGGDVAKEAQVKGIIDIVQLLPPVRAAQSTIKFSHLPAFSVKTIEEFKGDRAYANFDELKKNFDELKKSEDANPEKHPLRAAIVEGIACMDDAKSLVMEERLINPGGGQFDGKVKAAFLNKQKDPGIKIFEMESVLAKLKAAGEERDKEESKRWQANYDYTLARLQSRLVYIYEYNYLLGQIRADNLPTLEAIHNGWRLGSKPKVQCPEGKVKDMVKSINRTWKKIGEEYPGTPWAVLATRESLTALGMEWRPTRD